MTKPIIKPSKSNHDKSRAVTTRKKNETSSILDTDVKLATTFSEMHGGIEILKEKVTKLGDKDKELENGLDNISSSFSTSLKAQADQFAESLNRQGDKFTLALSEQSDRFTKAVEDITEKFVRKEDYQQVKNAVKVAAGALILYAWDTLVHKGYMPSILPLPH